LVGFGPPLQLMQPAMIAKMRRSHNVRRMGIPP
jgi:hypothetical protein